MDAAAAWPLATLTFVAFSIVAISIEGAAGGGCSGNFFRAGNPFSVAAEKGLEVDPKVGLQQFAYSILRAIAEDQTMFGGLIQRRSETAVPIGSENYFGFPYSVLK